MGVGWVGNAWMSINGRASVARGYFFFLVTLFSLCVSTLVCTSCHSLWWKAHHCCLWFQFQKESSRSDGQILSPSYSGLLTLFPCVLWGLSSLTPQLLIGWTFCKSFVGVCMCVCVCVRVTPSLAVVINLLLQIQPSSASFRDHEQFSPSGTTCNHQRCRNSSYGKS